MREQISAAVKAAMKTGDKRRLGTLRLMQAAIKDRDIASRVDDKGQASGRDKIDDAELLQLLQKMVKQRREAATTYRDAGRPERADTEEAEIAVIEEFMPRQLGDDEIRAAVAAMIAEIDAQGLKDMGRTMAALKQRFAGQMDFSKASALVKENLG